MGENAATTGHQQRHGAGLLYPDTEIIIGLVAPLGTDLQQVQTALERRLPHFRYAYQCVRLSDLFDGFALDVVQRGDSAADQIHTKMDKGNELRHTTSQQDALALAAIQEVRERRGSDGPAPRTAFVLRQLKHPKEVETLRQIYGRGFFLLGATAGMDSRREFLTKGLGMSVQEAEELIERDADEDRKEYGQRTRKTFELADAFVAVDESDFEEQVRRIVDLLFGHPFHTPTKDEYAMFMAYAASLRSADLSRQVGAVVMTPEGEVLATGANDVPTFGGGLYWPGDTNGGAADYDDGTQRDFVRGDDSNAKEREAIVERITNAAVQVVDGASEALEAAVRNSGLMDLTEYGRAVHAEMEALLACARIGVATRGRYLYSTTFPCHNCTKHIVASGIERVVYVEPYPKSKARELHGDAIAVPGVRGGEPVKNRVVFEPFTGIGPRRFIDLFSLKLGDGLPVKRKNGSVRVDVDRKAASPRMTMQPSSYLERETLALAKLDAAIAERDEAQRGGGNGDDGEEGQEH